jgi:hypothetical protein
MPSFTFTSPEGQKYTVNGPDGATQDQAFQILQGQIGSKQAQKPQSVLGGEGGGLQFMNSMPIVGPSILKAGAGINAALGEGKGDNFSERYADQQAQQAKQMKEFGDQHPIASTGAEIAGGIAGLGGAAATGPGEALLGLGAKTLPGMIAGGAAGGAAVGGLDAAARGNNPGEGAIYGGAAGAAGPLVGKAIGAFAKPFIRFGAAASSPEIEAAGQVREALERDAGKGLSPDETEAAENRGQPVTLMDAGGRSTQRLARRASNYSPDAQEKLAETTQGRYLTQNTRTADFLGEISNYPDAHATKQALDQTSKTVNRTLYAKAMEKGSSGVWNDSLAQLINHPWVKKAIPDALEQSNAEAVLEGGTPIRSPFVADAEGNLSLPKGPDGKTIKPTLEFWDALKKNIDGRVEGASATATSRGDPNTVRMGTNLTHALTRELDSSVPEYGTARAVAAKFFGAKDALQAGRQAGMPGTAAARVDNRVLRDSLNKYSPAERKLFEQGFLDQTIETLLGKPDSFNILRAINQNPRAKERMSTILGADRYAALESYLRVEGLMDRFRTAVSGNSTTAQQLGDMSSGSVVPNVRLSIRGMFEDFLTGAAKKLGAGVDERVASKIADMLTSGDGKEYAKAMRMITKNKRLMGALRQPEAAGAIVTRGAAQAIGAQP